MERLFIVQLSLREEEEEKKPGLTREEAPVVPRDDDPDTVRSAGPE